MSDTVIKFGGLSNSKTKVSSYCDYGWAEFVIANGGTDSSVLDIGVADSILIVIPSALNGKTVTIKTQTYDDSWIDLVSFVAATGLKVFTDATELAKIRHAQLTKFVSDSSVGAEAKIWVAVKG